MDRPVRRLQDRQRLLIVSMTSGRQRRLVGAKNSTSRPSCTTGGKQRCSRKLHRSGKEDVYFFVANITCHANAIVVRGQKMTTNWTGGVLLCCVPNPCISCVRIEATGVGVIETTGNGKLRKIFASGPSTFRTFLNSTKMFGQILVVCASCLQVDTFVQIFCEGINFLFDFRRRFHHKYSFRVSWSWLYRAAILTS